MAIHLWIFFCFKFRAHDDRWSDVYIDSHFLSCIRSFSFSLYRIRTLFTVHLTNSLSYAYIKDWNRLPLLCLIDHRVHTTRQCSNDALSRVANHQLNKNMHMTASWITLWWGKFYQLLFNTSIVCLNCLIFLSSIWRVLPISKPKSCAIAVYVSKRMSNTKWIVEQDAHRGNASGVLILLSVSLTIQH